MARSSCLCGAVAWEVAGPFASMTHCHCSMCRKFHGTAFGTYLAAPAGGFRWLRGEEGVARYPSSPGFERPFCSRCGSGVAGAPEDGLLFTPAGCLDDDPGFRPQAHIFAASKAPWHEIHDDLAQFDAYPEGMGEAVEVREVPAPAGDRVGGSCLCGEVAYELEPPLALIVDCHCSRCRKARAAAFAANLLVPAGALHWLRGEERLQTWAVPGAKRFAARFCRRCGSSCPRIDPERAIAVVPAGTLDHDPGAREGLHIFVGSKAPWYEIRDALPRFEQAPPEPPPR